MKRVLAKTYLKSETCFRNEIDRSSPVMYVRFAKVEVYQLSKPWGWLDVFGFFNKETEHWENSKSLPDSVFGESRPKFDKIFGDVFIADMSTRTTK